MGMGELHLDIKVDILKRTHGVEVEVGKPQVAYRETITQAGGRCLHPQEADRRFGSVRQDRLQCRAWLRPVPAYVFESRVTGGNVPREYWSCDRKRPSAAAWTTGTLAGFPLLDVKFTLIDGAYPRGGLLRHGV